MSSSSQIALQAFTVDVQFYSGDVCYGTETVSIVAATWYLAEREALLRSVDSPYDNDRIPHGRRLANARKL